MKNSFEPKGWIRGNTKIAPALEVTTCCLQGHLMRHVVCLILHDFSPFLFLLSPFSPVVLSFFLTINFFFHDVVETFPVHFSKWEPWNLCRVRPSHMLWEPNWFDDYHISETTDMFLQESSSDTKPSELAWLGDQWPRRALFSPLFTQEREEPTDRRQAYHSHDETLSSSQSSSVGNITGRTVVEQFDTFPTSEKFRATAHKMSKIRTLLERQSEQILADCQAEIRKHELQACYDRRDVQKLNEMIESQKKELHCAQADERLQQDHQLHHEQWLKRNWDLREAHEKSFSEMKELKRFKAVHSIQSLENWSKIEILSWHSLAKFRNCRMKSKMLNQYAVDILTLPVNQCFSHLIQYPKGLQKWAAKYLWR